MRSLSMFVGFLLCFVVAMTFMGCTRESKSLYIYTTLEEPLARALVNHYESKTGEKVEFVRLSTGEAAARIEAEKSNPQASMWLGGVGISHEQIKQRGLSEPYTPKGSDSIASQYKDPENYWTGLYLGVLAFGSNPQRLERLGLETPKTWTDLLEPKMRREVLLPSPKTSGTSYNLLTTLITRDGEAKAFEYFQKLHPNVAQYTKSGSAPAKNVAIGEGTVAVGYAHDMIRLKQESRAPLEVSFPADGVGYEIAAVSLIKNATQPEKAKAFIDWVYSPEASQILADAYVVPLIDAGVILKPEAINPKALKLIHVDMEWAGGSRERLLQIWDEKIKG